MRLEVSRDRRFSDTSDDADGSGSCVNRKLVEFAVVLVEEGYPPPTFPTGLEEVETINCVFRALIFYLEEDDDLVGALCRVLGEQNLGRDTEIQRGDPVEEWVSRFLLIGENAASAAS